MPVNACQQDRYASGAESPFSTFAGSQSDAITPVPKSDRTI
jgi:hypothetical protein